MQIFIPLANTSHNNYLELRYALRSFQKYLHQIDEVFIYGGHPSWITNVNHYRFGDIDHPRYKEHNIYKKTRAACLNPDIKDDFLFCNDDHFLLSNYRGELFPYYYHQSLNDTLHRKGGMDPYKYTIIYTMQHLLGKGVTTHDFDVHCPIMFNKEKFLKFVGGMNWERPFGYCIKSIYANQAGIAPVKYADLKFRQHLSQKEIFTQIKGREFFSTDDRLMTEDMITVLNKRFPKPSIYEL